MTSDRAPARKAFGTALEQARRRAGLTQTRLGELVDRKQQAVAAWAQGEKEPLPAQAIAVERALDVEPGSLTKHLGYLPLEAAGQVIETAFIDAVLADPDLTDGQRSSLLSTYREFTRHR